MANLTNLNNKFLVQTGGNVGIGTTSPTTKLHLGGTAPLDSIIRQDSTSSGTNWEIGERAAGKWQIWEDDGDTVVATFMSTGNVGIGTSSPDGNLEVIASTTVSGASDSVNNVLIGLQAANRPTIILDTADTTYTNRTWNITNVGSAGSLFFGRNGLDVLVMKNDGKVGIGVTSPIVPVHIVGTAVNNPSNGNGGYEVMQIFDDTSYATGVGGGIGLGGNFTGSNSTIFSEIRGIKENATDNNYAGALTFSTRANGANITERMRIASDGEIRVANQTLVKGSNSKYNMTFPDNGGIAIGSAYTFANIYGSSGNLYLRANSYPANTGSDSIIYLQTANSSGGQANDVVIKNGNVGIGTVTPQKALHIEGASGASASQLLVCGPSDTIGDTAGILLRAEGGEGDSALRAKGGIFFEREAANGLGKLHLCNNNSNNNDSADLSDAVLTILQDGQTSFVKSDNTSTPAGSINHASNDFLYVTGGTGGASFGDDSHATRMIVHDNDSVRFDTGGSERMRLTSGGALLIGQTSAVSTHLLTVNGRIGGPTFSDSYLQFTGGNAILKANDDVIIGYSSSLYVKQGGNVGIGTTSPASQLEVYGGSSGTNDVDRYVRFKASNGEKRFDFYMGGTGNASSLGMYTSDGTTKNVQIASGGTSYFNGGNVGIGTTSPDEKLDITGGYLKFNGGDYGLKGSASLTYNPVSDHYFQSNGSTKVTFKANGNVGIGTTSPDMLLDVAGNIRARVAGNVAGGFYIGEGNTSEAFGLLSQGANGYFKIRDEYHNSDRFYISNTGDVGIGKTSPSTTLDVQGVITAGDSTTDGAIRRQHQTFATMKPGPSSGGSVDMMFVDHTHSLDITVVAYINTSNVATGRGYSVAAYGSASAGLTQTSFAGNVSALSISYVNSGGSENYILRVTCTYSGVTAPVISVTANGQSTSELRAAT